MDKTILRRVQKPARYTGGEPNSVVKDKNAVALRYAFCFPDTYEVGMSHLGLKLLYGLMNEREDIWCERCFEPWFDMREQLKNEKLPLYALESGDSLREFDILGFTLQYELCYTNVLDMLSLADIPLYASQRGEEYPIVLGGGPCCCNPEPIADFFDAFALGEGEEVNMEICDAVIEAKKNGLSKQQLLEKLAALEGVYVPALYSVSYHENGTLSAVTPLSGAPATVKKRIISDFDSCYFPEKFVVPLTQVIHDRAVTEIMRGCVRGCRFCQAGFIYRPVRYRSHDTINRQARSLCDSCGYEEVSLTSLSTSDHPQLEPLLDDMLDWTVEQKVNISLPSLRIDNFSDELVEKTARVRKSGLTFAPEAGTQRLRDVINKNITEDEVMRSCTTAFSQGYTAVKLYFMMGLPTETDEDVLGIAQLAQKVVDLYYSLPEKPRGKSVTVSVSVSCFIPKPKTPFERCLQDTMAEFQRKQRLLIENCRSRKISLSWHDARSSFIEAVMAKGDRKVSAAIAAAWKNGAVLDGWDEGFKLENWTEAFDECGLDPAFYANRAADFNELMPWDMLDYGVSKKYLQNEYRRALKAQVTGSCHTGCDACGISAIAKGKCFEERKA